MTLSGQYLGHYHVIRQIGQGGMGEVYLAEDSRITRQVAIKVVRREQMPYPHDSTTQEAARLFQREMKAISQLDHSNILSMYDFGEEPFASGSFMYMVMPYRSEGSLLDWLAQRSSSNLLLPQDVANLLTQAASALQHAHNRNIVHQDVKPSNFLIRTNPEHLTYPDLFLVDFGVAKIMTATSTASNGVRGTYTYMAPEQWSSAAVPATDQYALAVMIYQLLTGIVPFQGRPEQVMFQHLSVAPKAPSALNTRLSPALDAVLLRALAKKPEERFPSVSAFAMAFRQALEYDPNAPTVGVGTHSVVAPTIAAPAPQSVPFLSPGTPVSSHGMRGLLFPLSIIGILVLIGAILVGVVSLNHSSGSIATPHTGANVAPVTTTTPSPPAASSPTPTLALTPTAIPAIPYPSYSAAEADIKYYYENESDFRGKNIIESFDSITYNQQTGPRDQPQFLACAQYKFVLVSSPNVTADTARHTFTFQYRSGVWSTIDMGNWNSC